MRHSLIRVIPQSEPRLTVTSNRAEATPSVSSAFIEANTVPVLLSELQQEHIIPVYVKDNEPLISQADFIRTTQEISSSVFSGGQIRAPQIRCSHPIKGRIPEAKDKPADQLLDWEKTLYYERMMFLLEIPSIINTIDGNQLTLTIGGVKAYNLDNLYNRKGAAEHFKVFIGFNNLVCTNLCVRTDGYLTDLRVNHVEQLYAGIYNLLSSFDQDQHLRQMQALTDYSITERQFAQLLGRCRMYQHLPSEKKKSIPPLLYGDSQLTAVCRDYYRDSSFCKEEDGSISLWKLYNLLTGANKSTYIDQFLDRSVNALDLASQIQGAVQGKSTSWYID
ncbi:DUF3871 family protein [Pontibacter sp. BT310]|uniref:DUF3871 family protein n=1 Tax=Pontibacter populi TaxID=890055 RepID=A0ABS6XDB1_9BACT|nr:MULTISPECIES: DUF3871 family protein [Pontibacter]MBJ6119007.1 DUF3871 family protein [Pontibacter sp. BT310]MBR0571435.1 DUF3871 family protein [Microvirga sp. STS03]MBW3365861.1 DUF3871 family protein [Pontibacter populi]